MFRGKRPVAGTCHRAGLHDRRSVGRHLSRSCFRVGVWDFQPSDGRRLTFHSLSFTGMAGIAAERAASARRERAPPEREAAVGAGIRDLKRRTGRVEKRTGGCRNFLVPIRDLKSPGGAPIEEEPDPAGSRNNERKYLAYQ